MKLKTLFFISLSTLMITIFTSIFYFNIKTMQNYIQNQVYSDSQDTAYSLGLSLSTIEKTNANSLTEMQIMINAIFDSGYYQYIKLYDINGSVLAQSSLPIVVKDVPQWFIKILPLHINAAKSDINSGWKVDKYLVVKGHIGYAYYELYKNFKNFLVTFSLITLFSLIALYFIINILLLSLKNIQKQAEAIDKHKFIIETKIPFIQEFNLLTLSMNHMVKKVETIFNSEVQTFQTYQTLKYKDEETQLPNKKYLILKLKELLENRDEEVLHAQMAIIYIDGLAILKKEKGYIKYKETLLALLDSMQNIFQTHALLTRISENEFAILFDVRCEVEEHLDKIQNSLHHAMLCLNTGLTSIDNQDIPTKILSRADYALQKSKIDGCRTSLNVQNVSSEDKFLALGKNAWHEKFEYIFTNNSITTALQSVINNQTKEVYHEEMLLRIIEDDGSINSAMNYIPMAYSLGVLQKFDQSLIDIAIRQLDVDENIYAINLSHEYVSQSSLFQELRKKMLQLNKNHQKRLHFESKESDILKELESYINFSEMLEGLGQCFGIDRFSGLENIEYIKKLRPTYIKVSVGIIEEFHTNNAMLLNSFNILCEVMDIKIIITSIQTQEQATKLQEMGYKYFQGYFVSKPQLI